LEFPLDAVADYTYTYLYTFTGGLTHSISGTLSVKACGATTPAGYTNMNTNSELYSVVAPLTGTFDLNAFAAPTNVNCTLTSTSYSIDETTAFGGLSLASTCSAPGQIGCLTIQYPLTTARLKNGSPAAFAYDLVVKYSNTYGKVVLT